MFIQLIIHFNADCCIIFPYSLQVMDYLLIGNINFNIRLTFELIVFEDTHRKIDKFAQISITSGHLFTGPFGLVHAKAHKKTHRILGSRRNEVRYYCWEMLCNLCNITENALSAESYIELSLLNNNIQSTKQICIPMFIVDLLIYLYLNWCRKSYIEHSAKRLSEHLHQKVTKYQFIVIQNYVLNEHLSYI